VIEVIHAGNDVNPPGLATTCPSTDFFRRYSDWQTPTIRVTLDTYTQAVTAAKRTPTPR
jgi:hypothetical protein